MTPPGDTAPAQAGEPPDTVLSVEGLRTQFGSGTRAVRAVDGVSFTLAAGEKLALVGESGSGKSVTALSIMRLVRPPGRVVGGRVSLRGSDLLGLTEEEMRRVRGRMISIIFQDPGNYLDPMFPVGHAIAEPLRLHYGASRAEARRTAIGLMRELKVPSPEDVVDAYPFQLSGGMCQRVLIAAALVTHPVVLIADEATSGLDVTAQASILRTLQELANKAGTAMLLTTHSMHVVREACTRVVVMYAGQVVETGPTSEVLASPLHPYTARLLSCLPSISRRNEALPVISGEPPAPGAAIPGCAFFGRCPIARAACADVQPALAERAPGHHVACPYPGEVRVH